MKRIKPYKIDLGRLEFATVKTVAPLSEQDLQVIGLVIKKRIGEEIIRKKLEHRA